MRVESLSSFYCFFLFFKIYSARLNTHSRTERTARNSALFVSTVRRTCICPWPRTGSSLSISPTQPPTPRVRTTGASSCTRSPTAACLYSRTTTKVGTSYLLSTTQWTEHPIHLSWASLYVYSVYISQLSQSNHMIKSNRIFFSLNF